MPSTITTLNCLIVDDEPLAQDVLAAHIARVPQLQLAGRCNNAMEAFEALHKYAIDLLFLDINMPVVSGLHFLRSLKDPPAVILTTAYTDYAMEGYELDVVDYLLKPISLERFLKAVKKAAVLPKLAGKGAALVTDETSSAAATAPVPAPAAPEKNYFFIKADGKLVKINHADIRYIEGMKDYLKIHLAESTVVFHHTMKAMEEQLPAAQFIRVHKSYIVALNAIASIAGNIIMLTHSKDEIPLGSSYREAVIAAVS